MRDVKVSFIVTALNEEANLAGAVESVLEATAGRISELEIIIVNDGSTDRTGEVAERLAAADSRIRVIHNPRNLGFGGAFKVGLCAANGEYVTRVCGDNTVPAASIAAIISRIGQADLVIPFATNHAFRPWYRRVGSRAFTAVINRLFGLDVPYYNHTVVFRREVLAGIRIRTNGFAYQAEAVVKLLKRGCTFVTVGVWDTERLHGESTALKPKNLLEVMHAVARLYLDVHFRVRPW